MVFIANLSRLSLAGPRGLPFSNYARRKFPLGLKDTGFVEGQNVTIEYRFAGNRNDQLLTLAADLVQRPPNGWTGPWDKPEFF